MKSIAAERPWYGIQPRSCFEKKYTRFFIKKGSSGSLHLPKKMNVGTNRIKRAEESIISAYMGIRFSENKHYRILNTQAVLYFVSFSAKDGSYNKRAAAENKPAAIKV